MGSITAMDLAAREDLNLEMGLMYHLQGNHYPPLPVSLIPACKEAIRLANNGEKDALVALPDGMTYKNETKAPVREIIDFCHLDYYLEENGYESQ